MSLHILLAEDDQKLASQLGAQLSGFGHNITTVGDGREALQSLSRESFDAVILDWMLPGTDGMGVLRQMRGNGMNVPVLMLTALGQTFDKVEGLETGADDYVVKPADPLEINARLSALIRARHLAPGKQDTISAGDIVVSPAKLRAWRADHALDLGNTEFKLLLELVRNAGAVTTKAMLLEKVWGYDFVPSTNIVEAHIRRLRLKLLEHGDDPISNVRGMGYLIRQ